MEADPSADNLKGDLKRREQSAFRFVMASLARLRVGPAVNLYDFHDGE